ncbi:MAG: helix-turn-helix domain-containing protein [Planctomycetes bacterium]|nr:helix-turn-helix domain-containing protein [Planctomycetota bacterium]
MSKLLNELCELIRADGRGVNKLGRASGVPPSSLSRLLNGTHGLGADHIEAVAKALGYTVELRPTPKLKKRSK